MDWFANVSQNPDVTIFKAKKKKKHFLASSHYVLLSTVTTFIVFQMDFVICSTYVIFHVEYISKALPIRS
jgi:hypothetical protein